MREAIVGEASNVEAGCFYQARQSCVGIAVIVHDDHAEPTPIDSFNHSSLSPAGYAAIRGRQTSTFSETPTMQLVHLRV